MIDLHVHSTRSDGTFTPCQLVDYAMEKGLSAFALTDHDTIDGLEEAIAYAQNLRDADKTCKTVPEIIPGIELSTEYQGKDIHIVGLFIDYKKEAFVSYLKHFVDSRHARNEKMCGLLSEAGIDISYEKLLAEFPNSVITRAHYAKYLYQHGYTNSIKEGFDRYVGDHCPYFVPREKVTPAQAVELILQADGIPVLAHPILYGMSDDRLDRLTAGLKAAGLIGIEAVYTSYTPADERKIRALADKYHLLISGGSDFHGANKPDIDLGVGYGKLYLHDCILDTLKKCRKNLFFSDMDGTLLHSDNTISSSMKTALNHLQDKGHRLILCSGRPLMSMLEVIEQTGLRYPGQILIAYNGALLYDCDKEASILEYRISQEDIALLVKSARDCGIHIHGYTQNSIVCYGMNEELKFYTRRIHLPLQCVSDIAAALPEGSFKMQCIHLTDHALLEAFRAKMQPLLNDRIQLIFSNDRYLEILPKEAGKGAAVRYLTDYLSMPFSHTFAAGDEENDISMLQAAHTGIAMKNATPKVKEAAKLITEKDHNDDGLLDIIEQYII